VVVIVLLLGAVGAYFIFFKKSEDAKEGGSDVYERFF